MSSPKTGPSAHTPLTPRPPSLQPYARSPGLVGPHALPTTPAPSRLLPHPCPALIQAGVLAFTLPLLFGYDSTLAPEVQANSLILAFDQSTGGGAAAICVLLRPHSHKHTCTCTPPTHTLAHSPFPPTPSPLHLRHPPPRHAPHAPPGYLARGPPTWLPPRPLPPSFRLPASLLCACARFCPALCPPFIRRPSPR